ncbi:hypothetical protein FB451DRAFT_1472522 [Mycena latifolia]|nr:hypothetical protein FB451DRAFT_1472522 [Mycena latifolia]
MAEAAAAAAAAVSEAEATCSRTVKLEDAEVEFDWAYLTDRRRQVYARILHRSGTDTLDWGALRGAEHETLGKWPSGALPAEDDGGREQAVADNQAQPRQAVANNLLLSSPPVSSLSATHSFTQTKPKLGAGLGNPLFSTSTLPFRSQPEDRPIRLLESESRCDEGLATVSGRESLRQRNLKAGLLCRVPCNAPPGTCRQDRTPSATARPGVTALSIVSLGRVLPSCAVAVGLGPRRALALVCQRTLTFITFYVQQCTFKCLRMQHDVITTERIDPTVNPGKCGRTRVFQSAFTNGQSFWTLTGGSNFRVSTNISSLIRQSAYTSSPIKEHKSNYWAPRKLPKNGSFTSVNGTRCNPGVTMPFPDYFRMLSASMTLRNYTGSKCAHQAEAILCLDFDGTSTTGSPELDLDSASLYPLGAALGYILSKLEDREISSPRKDTTTRKPNVWKLGRRKIANLIAPPSFTLPSLNQEAEPRAEHPSEGIHTDTRHILAEYAITKLQPASYSLPAVGPQVQAIYCNLIFRLLEYMEASATLQGPEALSMLVLILDLDRGSVEVSFAGLYKRSVLVPRSTRRLHLQEDQERNLKQNQISNGLSVSAGAFMASKRKKLPEDPIHPAGAQSANLDPPAPHMHDPVPPGAVIDEDVEMPLEPAQHPPLSFSDVEMTDTSIPIVTQAIEQPSSLLPNDPLTSPSASHESSTQPLEPRDSLAQESPFWFWQLILITVSWLHLHFHTPHRACTLLLKVLRNIFLCLALVRTEDHVPVTLTTTFKRLGLNEHFEIRAICPQCRRAYPESSPTDLMCSYCSIPLFNTPPSPTSEAVPLLGSNRSKSVPKQRPILQAPYLSLSTQIVEFLNRDGNEADCESYLNRTSIPGKMRDIQDGEICQSLKGPDGRKFFETGPDRPDPDELRIGRSFAATVTDLLMLYDDGILVKTPKYPHGRRVRVILVAICCDHPAMCKMGGFSDHKANKFPCSRCEIPHDEIKTPAGLKVDAFAHRDGKRHKQESAKYAKIPEDDKKARDSFASAHGTRYFEVSRLPYFDPVRQIIIDPMHCVFLGIFKTQWLDAWIKDPAPALRKRTETTPREIDHIHNYLNALEMPSWVARLPTQVGYPAGGSLGADELKGMLLIFCPLIIPHIWDEWYPVAAADHERAELSWRKKETSRLNRVARGTDKSTDHEPLPLPKPIRVHENDPDLLLKFSACMKILLAGTIDVQALPRAQQLLEDYLAGFLEIIRDFGPLYGFWTFLFERLNKLLKSYDTNNHGDGELEVTFFREFHRDANLREVVRKLAKKSGIVGLSPEEQCVAESARMILQTDGEIRGTVAAMACEIEQLSSDLGTPFSMGMAVSKELPALLQRDILQYYRTTYPTIPILDRAAEIGDATNPIFLHGSVQVHRYFILDGRRITSSASLDDASSSLVQLDADGTRYVGQIFNILTHHQPGLETPQCLLDIRWMRRLTDCDMSAWEPYPELEIFSWEYGRFLGRTDPGPGRFIPIGSVLSQACRLTIEHKIQIIEEDTDSDVEEAETSNGPDVVVV